MTNNRALQKDSTAQDIRVLVGGCFDVIHAGHIRFLNEAKKLGNKLIVVLESDESVQKSKGKNRPINSQKDRAFILENLKMIDEVILITQFTSDDQYYRLVKKIKPDIIAVTKEDPELENKKKQASSINARVVEVIDRIQEYSSTKVISKLTL